MSAVRQRLLDLLAAGRVANLPSVASNVFLGIALGHAMGPPAESRVLVMPALAGILLYLGGCFLNDWRDAAWDARHRPERAVPAGRWRRSRFGLLAAVLLAFGLFCAAIINLACLVVATLLTISIFLYTWLHKKTAWSALLMGLCRALLYPLGYFSSSPDLDFIGYSGVIYRINVFGWTTIPLYAPVVNALLLLLTFGPPCAGLLSYIAGVSLMARFESRDHVHRSYLLIAMGLIFLPVFTHSYIWAQGWSGEFLISPIPFLAVAVTGLILIRSNVRRGVGLFLAGIPLVDLILLLPVALAQYHDPFHDVQHPEVLLFPAVSLAAFLLALLLQRLAPAT